MNTVWLVYSVMLQQLAPAVKYFRKRSAQGQV